MKKLTINGIFPLLALGVLIFALSHQLFLAPPLGKFFDPFIGVMQNGGEPMAEKGDHSYTGLGLGDSVEVFFDGRDVPHIYARDANDLYFAQGYVTASLRLWQMDFLSYVAAGRMSELFGSDNFLGYDRTQRRIGMLEAAKTTLEFIHRDAETSAALAAYTKGVNAYIRQLDYRTLPFEYKLLDYKPEPWTELKSVLIMKYLANMLSGYEEDLVMSHLMLALGERTFNKLFPGYSRHSSPVAGASPVSVGGLLGYLKKPDYLSYSFLSSGGIVPASAYNPRLGSNSWAVSGKKTRSGHPILCSDPHLGLSLPSIWVEMQLSMPGMNVYGVSIPGTPAVIIGFNENVAWGITNGADDVKDWYKLSLTDDYKHYYLDGKWLDLTSRVEAIGVRGHKTIYDTVYSTMQGPVVYDKRFPGDQPGLLNYALRWEMHRPSDEFLCFIKLNRAKDYTDFKEAIRYYSCPVQNFTFAAKDDTIAVVHQGRMAVKSPGQGRFILDGSRTETVPMRYIPEDSLPQVFNPRCSYVFSANQAPTDTNYRYYYNGYYAEARANRIRQWLERDSFDIPLMEAMQLDNTNSFAVDALPVLRARVDSGKLNTAERKWLSALAGWNGAYDLHDEHARLFELWWANIKADTWDELRQYDFSASTPSDYTLLDLIRNQPCDSFFDIQGTAVREQAGDIVLEALQDAVTRYDSLRKTGQTDWGAGNKVNIEHMTRIPAFGRIGLPVAGSPDAIDAMASNWGPSWRMIVELGDRPRAFGIYAGGQSGNIGSIHYDDFVDDWAKGKYYSLLFFVTMSEARAQTTRRWELH